MMCSVLDACDECWLAVNAYCRFGAILHICTCVRARVGERAKIAHTNTNDTTCTAYDASVCLKNPNENKIHT